MKQGLEAAQQFSHILCVLGSLSCYILSCFLSRTAQHVVSCLDCSDL